MPLPFCYYIFLSFIYLISNSTAHQNDTRKRQLSVFTVVKFPNDVCISGTSGRNGTCYTNSECSAKGGAASGSCASSFGVCCVFEKTCGGGSVAENCTYFTSASRSAGASCTLTICKCSSDVCQLRLDFETFTLSEAYTSTLGADNSSPFPTRIGNCVTDFFSVSVPGGKAPPLICGENAGYHMYVPATDSCNALTSYFGSSTTTTTSAFTIKVTQVKCNAKNKAPDQCLQYFTASSGTFETYNYNSGNGKHLANQDYCYCFRAERTACTICYALAGTGAAGPGLGLGGDSPGAAISLIDTMCGYDYGIKVGAADVYYSSFDHIVIPNSQCPITTAANAIANLPEASSVDRYCGTQFICITGPVSDGTFNPNQGTGTGTICSSTKPFTVCIKTNGIESYDTNQPLSEVTDAHGDRGFTMRYWQSSSCLLKGGNGGS